MHDITRILRAMTKNATAVMTPEAMQAAVQPPMDPAMGGAPMDPAAGGMPGGSPMPPEAIGGAPAGAPPMDPAAMGGMPPAGPQGAGGGEIPPEILQDQLFMQFLQMMGVQFDPQSGTFIDPNGQPLSVDEVMQVYDIFQQQVAAQGGAPGAAGPAAGAPEDQAAMGAMPPEAVGAAPAGAMPPDAGAMPPDAGMPPEAAMGGAPGSPADMAGALPPDPAMAGGADMGAAGGMSSEDQAMEIASAVMSGVEATLEEFTTNLEKKMSAIIDKVETLGKAVDSLQETTDRRSEDDKDEEEKLRADLDAELMPTLDAGIPAPMPIDMGKAASEKPVAKPVSKKANLYNFICKKG